MQLLNPKYNIYVTHNTSVRGLINGVVLNIESLNVFYGLHTQSHEQLQSISAQLHWALDKRIVHMFSHTDKY